MKAIIQQIISDPGYLKNIEYGEPRPGHPEGKVKYHIAELEENLEVLRSRGISEEQYWKLKFLIHIHDTFKAEAVPNSPILHPNSHASLARKFASKFTADTDLLNMIQYHDVNYALWQQFSNTGSYDLSRFSALLKTIIDWDLFLMFLILDGCTQGKDPEKLRWFITEVRKKKQTVVNESWLVLDWKNRMTSISVQRWLTNLALDIRAITKQLHAVARKNMPGAHEFIYHDAIGYSVNNSPADRICYIAPQKKGYVNFGFFFGAGLPDPKSLLVGKGKRLRHVKIRNVDEAKNPALARLMAATWREAPESVAKVHAGRKKSKA